MILIYRMFRIKLKIIKHRLKDISVRFPFLLVIFIMLLVLFIAGSIFAFSTLNGTFNDSFKNMVITNMIFERIFVNVNNIAMFIILAFVILRNMSIRSDDLPEVLLVNSYKQDQIKKAYNYSSNILVFIFAMGFMTPVLFKFVMMINTSMINRIIVLMVQMLYFMAVILLALCIVILLKYILVYGLKIKKENSVYELIAVASMILLALILLAGACTSLKNYLPSRYILNLAAAMTCRDLWRSLIYIGINLINIISVFLLYKVVSDNFHIDAGSEIEKTAKTLIRMNNRYINIYLNVIIKMFFRNIEGFISLVSLLVFIILTALGLNFAGLTYKYADTFLYLVTFVMILSAVTFIQDFNDYEIFEAVKTYGGSLKKLNFILAVFYAALLFIVYFIFLLLIYKSLGIPVLNLSQSPLINLTLYVVTALLTKTIFLKKDSSLLIQMVSVSAYALIFSGVQLITANLLPYINIINTDSPASYYLLVIIFSVIIYLIQFKVLIYKKNYE